MKAFSVDTEAPPAPVRKSLHWLADIRQASGTESIEDAPEPEIGPDGAEIPIVVAGSAEIRAAQGLGQALPVASDTARGTLVPKDAVLVTCDDGGRLSAIVTSGPTLARKGLYIVVPKPDSGCLPAWICWTLRQAPAVTMLAMSGRAVSEGLRRTPVEVIGIEEQAARCVKAGRIWDSSVELVGLLHQKARLLERAREAAVGALIRHGRIRQDVACAVAGEPLPQARDTASGRTPRVKP